MDNTDLERKEIYFTQQTAELFMFEEMLTHMKENEENPNSIVGILPRDEEKHVLAFYTGRDVLELYTK